MGETQYKLPFPADRIAELLNTINELGAWAKASEKPTYTAEEVGARPSTWMPTASDVGARPSTWTPSASEVGADPSGTAAGAVSSHNTAADAHADIRLLVTGIANRMNALADCDDETLDQWSELVAYIKANRSLIEQITTGKISVSDIIDNLTTNVANKPLSAAQGVALKALIDAITVPTKVSQLENDSKFLTQHQDISGKADASDLTTHTGNTTVHVTAEERTKWNKVITDLSTLTLGIHTDGLIYLYVNGNPVGTGIEAGASGDVVGYVDSDNNIIVSGALAEGTYTVKYEMEDGTLVDIGILSTIEAPTYTNQIPISTDASGNLFVGDNGEAGYKTGYRLGLGAGVGIERVSDGSEVTGFIPATRNSVIRLKNITVLNDGYHGIVGYDSNKTMLSTSGATYLGTVFPSADSNGVYTSEALGTTHAHFASDDLAYIRICSSNINENSILTVDEEIV